VTYAMGVAAIIVLVLFIFLLILGILLMLKKGENKAIKSENDFLKEVLMQVLRIMHKK
jgi:hypothetical protein